MPDKVPAAPPFTGSAYDQMLYDTFITACEGGMEYWSYVREYHHLTRNAPRADDLTGFFAVVVDREDDAADYRVDRDVIAQGFRSMADGTATFGSKPMPAHWRAAAAGWLNDPENADIDAGDADNIVQCGIFGDVQFG